MPYLHVKKPNTLKFYEAVKDENKFYPTGEPVEIVSGVYSVNFGNLPSVKTAETRLALEPLWVFITSSTNKHFAVDKETFDQHYILMQNETYIAIK